MLFDLFCYAVAVIGVLTLVGKPKSDRPVEFDAAPAIDPSEITSEVEDIAAQIEQAWVEAAEIEAIAQKIETVWVEAQQLPAEPAVEAIAQPDLSGLTIRQLKTLATRAKLPKYNKDSKALLSRRLREVPNLGELMESIA